MERRVLCLGDSITWGFPYGPQQSWVRLLAEACPADRFFNRGVNGDTLADMRERLPRLLDALKPDCVVILGGINDLDVGRSPDDMAGDLEAMLALCRQRRAAAIPGRTTPSTEAWLEAEIAAWRERLQASADQAGRPVIDFAAPFRDGQGRLRAAHFCDAVHPSAAGYRAMGEAAASFWRSWTISVE